MGTIHQRRHDLRVTRDLLGFDGTERDLVIDGESGFFFKENDADDLATKLTILFEEPERAVKMGEAAWKVIRDKVNLDTVSERYIPPLGRLSQGIEWFPWLKKSGAYLLFRPPQTNRSRSDR